MTAARRIALIGAAALAGGVVFTGTAAANSPDCRDWWTVDDTARTVFTDATQSVKVWGHRSCGGTTTPVYWEAPYRPDEPSDYGWDAMKKLHGNDPGSVAYGFELHKAPKGWIATGFASAHG
ncbi:hypothetical protein [Kutzneria sp. 744]|uniref:hypothetical protein n=1 Tax=Kutzneria sp. (strain 744) TaxID=345341 RepID=UPI0005BAA432|nr:hypothetical protein [Kutzneria sp. 744]